MITEELRAEIIKAQSHVSVIRFRVLPDVFLFFKNLYSKVVHIVKGTLKNQYV